VYHQVFLWFIIIIILLFCSFFHYFSSGYAVTINDPSKILTDKVNPFEYKIELIHIVLPDPSFNFDRFPMTQQAYVRVIDQYGKDVKGIMNYSIDDSKNWTSIPMELINGIPSNGTFRALISDIKENSKINYSFYFEDEYGYNRSISEEKYIIFRDWYTPSVNNITIGYIEPHKPIVVRANVYLPDGSSAIENVTLKYEILGYPNDSQPYRGNLKKVSHSIPMERIEPLKSSERNATYIPISKSMKILSESIVGPGMIFDMEPPGETYQGLTIPFEENRTIDISVDAYSKKGNKSWSPGYLISVDKLTPSEKDPLLKFLNKIDIDTKVLNFNINNFTTDIQIILHESRFNNTVLPYTDNKFVHTLVLTDDNNRIKDSYSTELSGTLPSIYPKDEMYNLTTILNENENAYGPISLQGDPSTYPFDEYSLDLIYIFPIKGLTFREDIQKFFSFDEAVNASWKPSMVSALDNTDQIFKNLDLYCKVSPYYKIKGFEAVGAQFIDPIHNDHITEPIPACTTTGVIGYDELEEAQKENALELFKNQHTVLNIKLIFQRNHTIYPVVIPMLAIFFLLGAIFLFNFDDVGAMVSSRLTLTLGIFALIFTLPEIIGSMKPQTNIPTIADSMLSIIILTTIIFTISSIMSSSSIIRNWFPRRHSWIDGIVFVIASGFVILYFSKYLLDQELWWLIPTLLVGLGYGLLLRALGIRINKPLIDFFRINKKKDIQV
jgi:hypothetical protein